MEESKRINTLIVEDHEMVANSTRELLEETVPMVKVVAIARNADEARICADEKDKDNKIDLVIMDIRLKSNIDGISLGAELKKKLPELRVLIYSGEENGELVRRAINANVNGYVTKNCIEELRKAIKVVVNGGIYIDPSLPKPPDQKEKLTKGEKKVLKLIAKEKKDEEICQELEIKMSTLRTHRSRIMDKRALRNAVELYQYAIKCYPN